MQRQYVVGIVVVLAVALGGYFFWNAAQSRHYDSNELGLSFSYPKSYTISGHTEEGSQRSWTVLVLQQESATPTPQDSEGPPTIAMIALDNLEGQSLEAWVKGSAFSNFKLSNEALASTTVGGEPALAYHYSRLYENDAVAVIHGKKIYFFSAGWITQDDPIRQDFQKMLDSVRFRE